MEDIACMSLHEKFPWLKTFCDKFSKGYVDEEDLLKNLKNELNVISAVGKKRQKELFELIRSLFLHFWWRLRWKQTCTWKKEGMMSERSNDGCKLIAKLLEFVIYLGILLSKGNTNSPWITNIMQIVGILPDCDDIICTSLLSLSVKKKYHSALIAILKSILVFNIPQYIKEPVTFIKIMMLFKKWKMLTRDTNELISIKTSAKKFQAPPCLISWISSFNLDVSKIQKNKVSHQLLKKSSKGLLKNLKLVIEDQEISFDAKQSMHEDNYEVMGSTSAFHYLSDHIPDFENQLKEDVQDLSCQNEESWTQDESLIRGISENSTTCNENASIQDYLVDSELMSSVYPFFDETTHESKILTKKESGLKKSVIIENSNNQGNGKDSPSYFCSIGSENQVQFDGEETLSKTTQNDEKVNLVSKISLKLRKVTGNECLECVPITSTPKVDSADICSFKDPSMEGESVNLNFSISLAEKFPDSCEISGKNNQKKRNREYDKNTSVKKLKRRKDMDTSDISSQVYSDFLPSIPSPATSDDSNHHSLLICDLNKFDETAICESVSNGHEIPKIKDSISIKKRSQKSFSQDTLQNIDFENSLTSLPSNISKNVAECDNLEKSGKLITGVEANHKKPVPVNVKRFKLYNPDAFDNYKLPGTESGSDSSNGHVIPKIKEDSISIKKRSQKSSSQDTLQNVDSENSLASLPSNISKNVVECDNLKKSGKLTTGVDANHKKPVPVIVKRFKLNDPDAFDNYKLSGTEFGSDSSTLDFTVENKQDSPDNLSQYDGPSPLLFCSGSEFGLSDVFPKPSGTLLDYCFSDVEQLPQEIVEKEASEEEIAHLVLNSIIEKVSCYLDHANFTSVTTDNLNIYLDKMYDDQQLDLTLEKLSNELNDIIPCLSHGSTKSSATDNQMSVSGGSNESSFSNETLTKNVSSYKRVRIENFQPSSSNASSPFASSNSQWCASLNQNALTINCNLSEIGSNDSQININPIDSLIPLKIVVNLNSNQNSLSQRQCSEIHFPSTVQRNSSSNNFIHFHGNYCHVTSMSRPSGNETKASSPTVLSQIEPLRPDDQPTEYGSTKTICKSPNFIQSSTQEAVIYPTCDTFSTQNIVNFISKYNNTSDKQILSPLCETTEVDGNQREVLRVSKASNPSASLLLSPSNNLGTRECKGIYLPEDESEVTNNITLREECRSRLRPRNETNKPDYIGVFQGSESDVEMEPKNKKRKSSCKNSHNISNIRNQQRNVSEIGPQDESNPENHFMVQWLTEKYETFKKSKLPFSTVRNHHLKFCKDHGLNPLKRQQLNKLIHSVFRSSRITKQGSRSSYRYYYNGFRVKSKSSLDQTSNSRLRLQT